MNSRLSLSMFTVEIDGKPTLALEAKKHSEAENICEQPELRTGLTTLKSNGVPLCEENSLFRVRLAHPAEAAIYRQSIEATKSLGGLKVVYLLDVDENLFGP
jgi:hypothetical protein